jgi:hypothetical protein
MWIGAAAGCFAPRDAGLLPRSIARDGVAAAGDVDGSASGAVSGAFV